MIGWISNIIIIIMCTLLQESMSDDDLLSRLNDKSWPWFGDRYPKRCPKPQENWPACFNVRHSVQESVLRRAGIPGSVKPTLELTVVFSAPEEKVDICGKGVNLKAVAPFKLNAKGHAITDLLQQGAEIYRTIPSINWTRSSNKTYSVIFLDTGLYKVRGLINNITQSEGSLSGQVIWTYTPPANPSIYRNPNLIILIRENATKKGPSTNQLISNTCVTKGISTKNSENCRIFLSTYLASAHIEGLQVYYTDGSSKYEKYRVCTENIFCDQICTNDIKQFAVAQKSQIMFTDITAGQLDMYVNMNFYSVNAFNYTACCSNKVVRPFSFRAMSGDNLKVDDTVKLSQQFNTRMELEVSGSPAVASDKSTLYSVIMVDPDVPVQLYADGKKKPYGHYWVANMKYEDLYKTEGTKVILNYVQPTPPDSTNHHYYILLYSQTTPVDEIPDDFYDDDSDIQWKWDFSKLPQDFKLRSVVWFIAGTDKFVVDFLSKQNQVPCSTFNPAYASSCLNGPNNVDYLRVLQHVVNPSFQGQIATYPDPAKPDFDYDDKDPHGGHQGGFGPGNQSSPMQNNQTQEDSGTGNQGQEEKGTGDKGKEDGGKKDNRDKIKKGKDKKEHQGRNSSSLNSLICRYLWAFLFFLYKLQR